MKKTINKKTLLYVHPVFIVGSYDDKGAPNIMAASWGGICCSQPPCVTVSLRKATHSYWNIMKNKAYTLNIPSASQVKEADYAGIYSGKDENKFESLGLTPVHSKIVNAPYVEEFPMNMICKVIHTYEIGLHTQFIGEVVESYASEEYLGENGLPDVARIDPFIYDSSSRGYFRVGEKILDAYSQTK